LRLSTKDMKIKKNNMNTVEPIEKWKFIFLDTSVIIDLLLDAKKFDKNIPVQNRINDTKKLFKYFNDSNIYSKKQYVFYVSAITVSELTAKLDNDLILVLLKLFSSGDLTFVDFTKDIALTITNDIKNYLPNHSYNQFISRLKKELKDDNSAFSKRSWIIDDLKIASSAKSLKQLDVVLTADKKTFSPICLQLNLPFVETSNLPKDLFDEISTKHFQ